MGKYFRNGKLWSGETFNQLGSRTLAAGVEGDLWQGTAATRPQPGGIQLRLISSSAQDDSVKTQRDTVTFAGTMDPATKDKWTCTLAGALDTGDIARLTLDGVNFDTECTPAIATLALRAAAVASSAMSGSYDSWKFVPGGVIDAGDVGTLVIGTNSYTFASAGGAGADAAMAAGLAAAAAADPIYPVTSFSTNLKAVKKTRGVGLAVSCSFTTDPGLNATVTTTHTVIGAASQTAWNVTDNGVSAVVAERAVAGVTAGTVASSYATDAGAASTFTAVHTVTGANADVLAVSDGTTTFSRTVLTAVLADEVAALAALINASALYVASGALGVITVDAATPGVGFTLANASTDNQTADLTVTIAHPIANGAGTGVQSVRLDYLDSAGVAQSEIVSMNGATAVLTTATDCGALLGITATAVGSTGAAVGTVDVTNVAGATVYGSIAVGATQDQAADYTVPAKRNAYVTCLCASAGAVGTLLKLYSNTNPVTGAIVSGAKFVWSASLFGTNPGEVESEVPLGPFPAGARVWLAGTNAGGCAVVGQLEGYLEPAALN